MKAHRFNQEWHDLVLAKSPFKEIERWLESAAKEEKDFQKAILPPALISGWRTPPSREAQLELTAFTLEVLRRKLIVRSLRLIVGLITSFNDHNYTVSPIILRALLEEGANGVYGAKKLRDAWKAFQSGGEWETFRTEQERFLMGSRTDQMSVWASVQLQHPNAEDHPEGMMDIGIAEVGTIIALGREKHLEVEPQGAPTSSESSYPWAAANVVTMVRAASRFLSESNRSEHPADLLSVYSWLSDAAHPSSLSWRFLNSDIIGMPAEELSDEDQYRMMVMMTVIYAEVCRTFVLQLLLLAHELVVKLALEVISVQEPRLQS